MTTLRLVVSFGLILSTIVKQPVCAAVSVGQIEDVTDAFLAQFYIEQVVSMIRLKNLTTQNALDIDAKSRLYMGKGTPFLFLNEAIPKTPCVKGTDQTVVKKIVANLKGGTGDYCQCRSIGYSEKNYTLHTTGLINLPLLACSAPFNLCNCCDGIDHCTATTPGSILYTIASPPSGEPANYNGSPGT